MAFLPPTFNLVVNIWRGNLTPGVDPPSVVTVGNLAWGRRSNAPATGGTGTAGVITTSSTLMLPALTDVQTVEKGSAVGNDYVEAPAASGRLYNAVYVDDIGKGFTNEHRACFLVPVPPWPTPYP